jgi:hypothetical protein
VTPKLDRELAKHLQERIEVIVTDSAANELLAGDIGRGRREGHAEDLDATASAQPDLRAQLTETLTPNLILIGRDLRALLPQAFVPKLPSQVIFTTNADLGVL